LILVLLRFECEVSFLILILLLLILLFPLFSLFEFLWNQVLKNFIKFFASHERKFKKEKKKKELIDKKGHQILFNVQGRIVPIVGFEELGKQIHYLLQRREYSKWF